MQEELLNDTLLEAKEYTMEDYENATSSYIFALVVSAIRTIAEEHDFVWENEKETEPGKFIIKAFSVLKSINEEKFTLATSDFADVFDKESIHTPKAEISKIFNDLKKVDIDTADVDIIFYGIIMNGMQQEYLRTFDTSDLHRKPLAESLLTEELLNEGVLLDWGILALRFLLTVGVVAAAGALTVAVGTISVGFAMGMVAGFPAAAKYYVAAGTAVNTGAAKVIESLGKVLEVVAGAITLVSKTMLRGFDFIDGVEDSAIKTFHELKTVLDHAIDHIDNAGTEVIDAVNDITTLTWNNLKMIGADAYNATIGAIAQAKTKLSIKNQIKTKKQLAKMCPSASLEEIDALFETIENKKITPRDSQVALDLYNKQRALVKQTIELNKLANAETERTAALKKAKDAKKAGEDAAAKDADVNKKSEPEKAEIVDVVDPKEEPKALETGDVAQLEDKTEVVDVEPLDPAFEAEVDKNIRLLASLDTNNSGTELAEAYDQNDLLWDASMVAAGAGIGAAVGQGLPGALIGGGAGLIVALIKNIIKRVKLDKETKQAIEKDKALNDMITDLKTEVGERKANIALQQLSNNLDVDFTYALVESVIFDLNYKEYKKSKQTNLMNEGIVMEKYSKESFRAALEAGKTIELGYNTDGASDTWSFSDGGVYASTEYSVSLTDDGKYDVYYYYTSDDGDIGNEGNEVYNTYDEFIEWLKEAHLEDCPVSLVEDLQEDAFNLDFQDRNVFGEALDDTYTCCICGEECHGYGNNPEPVKHEGKCCDACNRKFVIPARIAQLTNPDEE